MRWTVTRTRLSPSAPRKPSWPRAAQARCTCTPRTPTPPRATALPPLGVQAAGWRTWSSSSSTPQGPVPPARKILFSSARRWCAARAATVAAPIGRWHALHARPRPTRRTGPARCGGPRHRLRDEKARLDCVHLDISHQSPRFAGALPNILALRVAGHRHHPSPSPWCPRPTSPAAAC